jgi:hypothetical protein
MFSAVHLSASAAPILTTLDRLQRLPTAPSTGGTIGPRSSSPMHRWDKSSGRPSDASWRAKKRLVRSHGRTMSAAGPFPAYLSLVAPRASDARVGMHEVITPGCCEVITPGRCPNSLIDCYYHPGRLARYAALPGFAGHRPHRPGLWPSSLPSLSGEAFLLHEHPDPIERVSNIGADLWTDLTTKSIGSLRCRWSLDGGERGGGPEWAGAATATVRSRRHRPGSA